MPQKVITDSDELLAAYLFSMENRSQVDIAEELGISPAVVSRMLARVDGRYFERKTCFLNENVPAELKQELDTRLLAGKISSELNRVTEFTIGRPGPKVRVFRAKEERSGEERLGSFARMAAPFVLQIISRTSKCGITWGRMLANFVKAAKEVGVRTRLTSTEFVPLAGEPLGFAPTSSSSSILADELQQLLRGNDRHARSLTMLPALIPRDFRPKERETIKKLISRLRDYQEIFLRHDSGEPPIAATLDGLITSVGRDPLGFRDGSLLDENEERPFFLGDIGGVLLPTRPENDRQKAQLKAVMDDFTDRWTGLRLEHVRACAERAASGSGQAVGVVVLSVGAERAPVIFECVKLGIVSYLIIDDELEKALLKECRVRSQL